MYTCWLLRFTCLMVFYLYLTLNFSLSLAFFFGLFLKPVAPVFNASCSPFSPPVFICLGYVLRVSPSFRSPSPALMVFAFYVLLKFTVCRNYGVYDVFIAVYDVRYRPAKPNFIFHRVHWPKSSSTWLDSSLLLFSFLFFSSASHSSFNFLVFPPSPVVVFLSFPSFLSISDCLIPPQG